MDSLHFIVTLESDVVFSEHSATTGAHTTLDYLPGSAFLGACAGKLYDKDNGIKGDDAFTVFHSGKVRFGDAYPLKLTDKGNILTYPIPLSWQYKKGAEYKGKDERLKNIKNLVPRERDDGQAKQLRDGFFTLGGLYFKPDTAFRLKTAVDRNSGGRASDEQLFGYESLKAGSYWYFSVDFDDDIKDNIKNKIKDSLEKTTRIGKSRSAEYGKVKIIPITYESKDYFSDIPGILIIYCLSDLALRDKNGKPTLTPDPSHFNLKGTVSFMPEKSFIRTRTYSPYNNYRKANDLERQVICRGSVITFNLF